MADYFLFMKENQYYVYFIAGESKDQVCNFVFVEPVKAAGFEVIYLTESIVEYAIQSRLGTA